MAKNKTLRDHAGELAEQLVPAVETAREKAAPLVADARDKAAPLVSDARDRVVPVLVGARDVAAPYLVDARDVAAPYVATARDKAAPYVLDARDKVSGTFTSEVLPVVTAALAALDDATEEARHETLRRGRAVAAALRGEIETRAQEEPVVDTSSESSHWLRTIMVVLGLGAAGFAVVKRLNSKQRADSWQSSYTPPSTRPSTPPASSTSPSSSTPLADAAADSVADDVAASDPAEAAADAHEAPHVATTPDNPATEIDVDKR